MCCNLATFHNFYISFWIEAFWYMDIKIINKNKSLSLKLFTYKCHDFWNMLISSFSLSKIHEKFKFKICPTWDCISQQRKMINPFRLLHIKSIFKEYYAILWFNIFSLYKSLKMLLTQFFSNFEYKKCSFIDP